MKRIKIILSVVLMAFAMQSCSSQKVVLNREVYNSKDGKMLLGQQSIDQFQKEPYSEWYNKEYNEYQMDQTALAQLKKEKLTSYNITVFLGTWCEDSHREFPRLMKILDAVNYPAGRLEIIGVNRKRESPGGEEGQRNIQLVPTIIVYKYGKELGRIIEFPKSGWLEKDLLEIITKEESVPKDTSK